MTFKISVGLSKKIGQANYGSFGASCQIELLLDTGEQLGNSLLLQTKISEVFCICKRAVESELAFARQSQQQISTPIQPEPALPKNCQATAEAKPPQSKPPQSKPPRSVTRAQVRALQSIANQGSLDLAAEVKRRFGCDQLEHLSIRQASSLIDRLKAQLVTA